MEWGGGMGVTGSRGKERREGTHVTDKVQTSDSRKMDERKKNPVLCYISREGNRMQRSGGKGEK